MLSVSIIRFLKFLALFLLLAGDFNLKPASLEANIPAVACDGRANILFAPEVFLTDRRELFSGCSTVVAVLSLVLAALVRACVHRLRTFEDVVQETKSHKVCTGN